MYVSNYSIRLIKFTNVYEVSRYLLNPIRTLLLNVCLVVLGEL